MPMPWRFSCKPRTIHDEVVAGAVVIAGEDEIKSENHHQAHGEAATGCLGCREALV